MKRAIHLARGGLGQVSPNPLVGAILVKNNKVIGTGFHMIYGGKHAEVNALESCTENYEGSTLYCNLEPCSTNYSGKHNKPCCYSIIKAKIKRVVIGQLDPNPNVSGSGVAILKENGIEVVTGVLEKEALDLNKGYNTCQIKNRPFVHLKWAQTLDGKIATNNGVSKWITKESLRKHCHSLRAKYDAILVGRNTYEQDNPTLNARYGYSPSPRPIVIDKNLKLKPDLNIFKRNPIIFCLDSNSNNEASKFSGNVIKLQKDLFSIEHLLKEIKKLGINSLFVEGGQNLLTQFITLDQWDVTTVYMAPKILGSGLSPIGNLNINNPGSSVEFKNPVFEIIDNHIVFTGFRQENDLCLQE